MGCLESLPSRRPRRRLTEERGLSSYEIESADAYAHWTKLLMSRSLVIDFRDGDNRAFYEESDFVVECLQHHNLFRCRHNAPPLKLNPELCHSAQTWANHLAHTGYFYHQNLQNVGENLYSRWNYPVQDCDVTGKEVTDYWYRGNIKYKFDLEADVLHVNGSAFTQMVWVSTEEIGIGKARSRDGKYVIAAHYSPQGNIPGHFYENVLPISFPESQDYDGSTRSSSSKNDFGSAGEVWEPVHDGYRPVATRDSAKMSENDFELDEL